MKFGTIFFALLFGSFLSALSVTADDSALKTRLLYFSSFPEIRQPAGVPGLAELASAIQENSQEIPDSYFIDGGASLGPSVLGSMDAGAHMVDLMNALNPSLMAVGKKEFSYGFDQFLVNANAATFPVLTSNLVTAQTGETIETVQTDFLITSSHMTIGFIALTSSEAVTEYGARQVQVLDADDVVSTKSMKLRAEGADAIVLLADTDFDDLSHFEKAGLVDVIFYTHNFDNPHSIDHQGKTYSKGALDHFLIVLDLWQEQADDGTVSLQTDVSFVDITTYVPDPHVDALVKSYQVRLDRLLGSTLATLKYGFNTYRDNVRSRENAFANIVTAAIRKTTNADAALLNAGSIRGNAQYRPEQQINRGDIQRELPFENRTVLLRLSGSTIRETLEHSIDCGLRLDGCFVHFDNINMTYNSDLPAGERIVAIELNGQPLNDDQMYRVAVPDFMARGHDGFTKLENAERISEHGTNRLIWRVVADFATDMNILEIKTDGRLVNTATSEFVPN